MYTTKNTYLPSTVPKNSPWSEPVIISSLPIKYNTRHKSLKQEPFVLNFLQISYIHSWHLRSHLHLPLSFRNVEPGVFWSSETTVIPKSTLGKGKITQSSVSRFVTSIVACTSPQVISTSSQPFLISRIAYNPFVFWISPWKTALMPVRQVKNKNH